MNDKSEALQDDFQKALQKALNKQANDLEEKHLQDTARLLDALKERFGGEVEEIVDRFTSKKAHKDGEELARKLGSNTIEDIVQELWVNSLPLGLEYTSEEKEDGLQMKCTKCYVCDTVKRLGVGDWGYHLFCVGDPSFVEGFNPKIGFIRTKSIMEGHDCCNHFFYMKK